MAAASTIPVVAAGLMGLLVWKRGRDEQYAGLTPGLTPVAGAPATVVRGGAPTVAVQFTPPAGVAPGLVGTVLDEEANTIDVSATVVDLAVRGYLRIEEVSPGGLFSRTDWRLTRLDPPRDEPLARYEQTILDGLFATANPVLLSELKNHFASTLRSAQAQMYAEVTHRGWFRESPEQQRRVWQGIGTGLVVLGPGLGVGPRFPQRRHRPGRRDQPRACRRASSWPSGSSWPGWSCGCWASGWQPAPPREAPSWPSRSGSSSTS